jgi:hypothetical protein
MNLGPVKGPLLAAATAGALLVSWPGGAMARTGQRSGSGTPQCAATTFCATPALYGSRPELWLGMAVAAGVPNAPVIVERIDPSDPGQDWTIELAAQPPAGPARRQVRPGFRAPHIPAPHLAALEYSPGGIRTDLCAANVADRLVLRHCNGTNWQLFIITTGPGGGALPPGGWWYFLSNVHAGATGRHLAMAAAHFPGARITFAEPRFASSQWWRQAGHCGIAPRRAAPRGRRVC